MIDSVFGQMLKDLLQQVPKARAAVFADWEGEMVDLAMATTDYDVEEARIRAAHWGIIYFIIRDQMPSLTQGSADLVMLNFAQEVVLIKSIDQHYFLTLSLDPSANIGIAMAAAERISKRIQGEM